MNPKSPIIGNRCNLHYYNDIKYVHAMLSIISSSVQDKTVTLLSKINSSNCFISIHSCASILVLRHVEHSNLLL